MFHQGKVKAVAAIIIALFAFNAQALSRYDQITPEYIQTAEQKFLVLLNQYRAQNGLPLLALNTKLKAAAHIQAVDMATNDFISHVGSNGSRMIDRVAQTGYRYRTVGENLGAGQASVEQMMTSWKNSPGHNANLLMAGAREMGLVLAYNPNKKFQTYWVLELGASF